MIKFKAMEKEMKNTKIEPYVPGDENEISQLIKSVYDDFVSIDYSVEGNNTFYEWIKPENIKSRQREERNMFVARSDGKIVGVIEIRNNNHISLLFVDKLYQNRGIAGRLISSSIDESLKRDLSMDTYEVNSSPYAIPIYSRLGFVAIGGILEKSGIKYQPMILKIKNK
ncbi:MAG: hypothetical protein H6Q19_1492 [Bacteroidetes bacterium]|nr:hypothetical protein [Bacteroidota bacterium]